MKLLAYLDSRRLGFHSPIEPTLEGINDIETCLRRALQCQDHRTALFQFCYDNLEDSIDDEEGHTLLSISEPEDLDATYSTNWIEIGIAGYPSLRDDYDLVYVHADTGEIYDTFWKDTFFDLDTYLDKRRKWIKEFYQS
jgi:hypothetical protein